VHVLLDRDARLAGTAPLGPLIHVHRLTSSPGQGLIAVRPDGYIGFRCKVAKASQLNAWLARVGAAPCREKDGLPPFHQGD
jgi:hypothetical protein